MSGVDLERVMLVTGGSRRLSLMNAGLFISWPLSV